MDIPQELLEERDGRLAVAIGSLLSQMKPALRESEGRTSDEGFRAAVREATKLSAEADNVIESLSQALEAARLAGSLTGEVGEMARQALAVRSAFTARNESLSAAGSASLQVVAGWESKVGKHTENIEWSLPALPPYVYGRETGPNEKLYTQGSIERWRAEVSTLVAAKFGEAR